MAEKLSLMNQLLFGDWSERSTINRNAEELSAVGADLGELRRVVQRQSDEILRLRAMFMGVVEVLQAKAGIGREELEHTVQAAWTKLNPPPPSPKSSETPPSEPSAGDVEAAKAILKCAQDHHFSKRFLEARAAYQEIAERYSNTQQAMTAREQLKNLRGA